jgi:hypothetical protein
LIAGCDRRAGDYLPASSISKDGFARDAEAMRAADGMEIRVWGFVDYANVDYGVASAPADARFPGVAAAGDLKEGLMEAGRSGRPVRASATGRMRTSEAPANFRRYTGFCIVVPRSQAVSLDRPD